MPRLTDLQRRPLDVLGTSVVLSAGAGCGKTTVLTERFVSALAPQRRTPLDRIVALTFTDKAASELRGRVREACRDRLDAGEDTEYWRGILRGLEAAPIGTFHTFCGEIVREYAIQAGIDPGFTVLDPSLAWTCREDGVDAALRQALIDRDRDLHELAVEFGLDSVRETLIAILEDDSASELGSWAEVSVDELVEIWERAWETRGKPVAIRRLARRIRSRLRVFRDVDCSHATKLVQHVQSINALLDSIETVRNPVADFEEILSLARIQGVTTKKGWPEDDFTRIGAAFGKIRDLIKGTLPTLEPDRSSSIRGAVLGRMVAALGAKALHEFTHEKAERGAVDFNDMLIKARDLLRDDASTVRADLVRRFDLILVDEFQDTDPIQDEIIRRIAGDDFALGRLFLVGDVKQSIYAFRGARPDLFARYREGFPVEGRLPLTENFRSRSEILEFVNALFGEVFTPYEPLVAGRRDPEGLPVPAVVFTFPAPSDDSESKDDKAVAEKRAAEAVRLASVIRGWIDEQRPIRDRRTGEIRPMHAGDVAYLFRTIKDVGLHEAALKDVGLDSLVIGRPTFYSRQEVQDLVNVLSVLDNPFDPLALAGALRSPFFALTDEALFWLSSVRVGDLFAGLARCDEETLPYLSPTDRRRARRAFELIMRWRGFKDRESIAALVMRVIEESGFEAALLGESLGDRKRGNIRELVKMARHYDLKGGFTLADFTKRLRGYLQTTPKQEEAATTDELGKAVKLLTVHKAKGLEFPVVVLPNLDRRSDGNRDRFVLDPVLGPLVKAMAEGEEGESMPTGSLGLQVYKTLKSDDEDAEALRVFYVATTRARDFLVLSTADDPARTETCPAVELLRDRFDLDSGRCTSESDVRVEVLASVGPSRTTTRIERAKRPPLLAIARLIEANLAAPVDAVVADRSSPRPHFLHLDASSRLSPKAERIDRATRAILLDPRSVEPGRLDRTAAEIARRSTPAESARIIGAALQRIRGRVEGPFGRALATAAEVRRDVRWSIAWPDGGGRPTVIEGVLDLAYRDRGGPWTLVQISSVESAGAIERLRSALTRRLASKLGLEPVDGLWRLVHGEGGGLFREESIEDGEVDRLIDLVLAS